MSVVSVIIPCYKVASYPMKQACSGLDQKGVEAKTVTDLWGMPATVDAGYLRKAYNKPSSFSVLRTRSWKLRFWSFCLTSLRISG